MIVANHVAVSTHKDTLTNFRQNIFNRIGALHSIGYRKQLLVGVRVMVIKTPQITFAAFTKLSGTSSKQQEP
jgi:hypothetical protein